jgi:hypothetical protein
MNGPDVDYRESIWRTLDEIPNRDLNGRFVSSDIEERLEAILEDIHERMQSDVQYSNVLARPDVSEGDARSVLSAIESWASVASYAVSWIYAPQSPPPWKLAGWIKDIPEKLRDMVETLRHALLVVAHALRVDSWTIGVSFPWGVSVSVGWNVT